MKFPLDQFMRFARALKIDSKVLRACVESGKYKEQVQSDVLEAMKIGANGTPTFVVGRSIGNGVDGEMVMGAMPYQLFDDKLKALQR